MKRISVIPELGDRGMHVETLQLSLKDLGFNFGNIDGSFGMQTKKALSQFQASKNIDDDGNVTNETLQLLEIEVESELDNNPFIAIPSMVDQSKISKIRWENGNRGLAPYGYYFGMGLMYAAFYERLKKKEPIVLELAAILGDSENKDALLRFRDELKRDCNNNLATPNDRLRGLMVLMFGLGLMETNGKYCCGWDRSKIKRGISPNSVNSEAGLFQTSYDVVNSVDAPTRKLLLDIFQKYKLTNDGYIHYFSKGVACTETNLENIGDGEGMEFQRLSKECPAFTVEFTALALRNIATHWNPVINIGDNAKGLQIKNECDELLKSIQQYVDDNIELAPNVFFNAVVDNNNITLKQAALEIAHTLGQRIKLQELFNYAPDSNANFWAIVDFTKPSSEKRLFIFDLEGRTVKSYCVSHGINSGSLLNATDFSNEIGSNKSCVGVFKTGTTYMGDNGRSLNLHGLEDTNNNAFERRIVIHQGIYVTENSAGRSHGCFVVSPQNGKEVLDKLRDGSYLLAWAN